MSSTCGHSEDYHVRKWLAWGWGLCMVFVIVWYIPSAQKHARATAKANQLALVLSQIEQAVVIVNEHMEIELFSGGAETLFGVKEDVVVGQPMLWMLPPLEREAHLAGVAQFWQHPDSNPRVLMCDSLTYAGEVLPVRLTMRGCLCADGRWRLCAFIVKQEVVHSTIQMKPFIKQSR